MNIKKLSKVADAATSLDVEWFEKNGKSEMENLRKELNKDSGVKGKRFEYSEDKNESGKVTKRKLVITGRRPSDESWDDSEIESKIRRKVNKWMSKVGLSKSQEPEIEVYTNYGHGDVSVVLSRSAFK